MNKTAMYAFSGDPITNGHINIIDRVSEIFDTVIVAIGVNPNKTHTFTLEERLDMAKHSLSIYKNVKVISFEGLLVDCAYENGVDVLIRGIRNQIDFDYEEMLHNVNLSQELGIETMCVFADSKLAHISSSSVKALMKEKGFIHDYVPLYVKQKMEEKLSNVTVIGLTGTIGSGKSHIANKIKVECNAYPMPILHLDLDEIAHDILNRLEEPGYAKVRKEISDTWSDAVLGADGFIDRKTLGQFVFGDPDALRELNHIMREPLLVRIRKEMRGFRDGIILLDGALLAEAGLNVLCNNNIMVLDVDKKTQINRLHKRGSTTEQVERRINSQYSFDEKMRKLNIEQQYHHHGTVLSVDNSGDDEETMEAIINYIHELRRWN